MVRHLFDKIGVSGVANEKCGRSAQYRRHRLIVRYGLDANLFDRSDEIAAAPRRPCIRTGCPDLPEGFEAL
jgi:hypothetical protein